MKSPQVYKCCFICQQTLRQYLRNHELTKLEKGDPSWFYTTFNFNFLCRLNLNARIPNHTFLYTKTSPSRNQTLTSYHHSRFSRVSLLHKNVRYKSHSALQFPAYANFRILVLRSIPSENYMSCVLLMMKPFIKQEEKQKTARVLIERNNIIRLLNCSWCNSHNYYLNRGSTGFCHFQWSMLGITAVQPHRY